MTLKIIKVPYEVEAMIFLLDPPMRISIIRVPWAGRERKNHRFWLRLSVAPLKKNMSAQNKKWW